jgi:hypothetical protein
MSVPEEPPASVEEAEDDNGWQNGCIVRTEDGINWFLCTAPDGLQLFVPEHTHEILSEYDFLERYSGVEMVYRPPEV